MQRNGKYVGTRPHRAAIRLTAGLAALLVLAVLALVPTGAGAALGWWLTNNTPPQLDASAPSTPQRSVFTVASAGRPAARASLVSVTVDGAPIATVPLRRERSSWLAALADAAWLATHPGTGAASSESLAVPVDTTRLADGPHTLRLVLEDRSLRHNRVARELTFVSDNTPPRITVAAPSQAAHAGQPVALRVSSNEPATLRASAGGDALPLFPLGGDAPTFVGFFGTAVDAPATSFTVSVHAADLAGNTADTSATVSVQAQPHPKQDLEVPPSLASLATGPVASAEAAQVASLTSTVRTERLWGAPFKIPFPAAVRTTDFGERRDYPDGYVTYHAGYDLAVPLGAPVPAAADGIVVFAGPLPQRGNAVVLDHGWGVFTVYAHSSRIEVQVGQSVTQGQTIALVGSTGLSTGAHLHWEVRLRGVPVDPAAWVALSQTLG